MHMGQMLCSTVLALSFSMQGPVYSKIVYLRLHLKKNERFIGISNNDYAEEEQNLRNLISGGSMSGPNLMRPCYPT